MKNKKRLTSLLCLILCASTLFVLASCTTPADPSGKTDPTADPTANPTTEPTGDPTPTAEPTEEVPVDTRENVDLSTLFNKLSTTRYTSNIKTDGDAGLSDPSVVGIIESELDDVHYPVPADSEFVKIYNVADYGVSTSSTGAQNSSGLRQILGEAKNVNGLKKVVFPAGIYLFSQTITLTEISDLYICCAEAGKQFEILMTSWMPGIKLTDCKNIHFNNYDFDYETPSAVTGKIVSVSAGAKQIVLKIDEEFDLTKSCYNGGKITWGSYMEYTYDETAGRYYPDLSKNLLYNSTGDQIKNIENGAYNPATRELTLTFKNNIVVSPAGTLASICYTMYENFGFYAQSSENVYLESVNLYHTTGMAIGAARCTNLYLNRVKLALKEGSSRLVTATADGFHPEQTHGEIVVTNCVFEASHDDSMNIKCAYQKIVSAMPKAINYDPSSNIEIEVGDTIEIYRNEDLSFVGSYTVTKIDTASKKYTVKEKINDCDNLAGALLCVPTQAARVTIHNTFFGFKRNRGMLIQTRNVEISNCTFQNVMMGPVQIFSVCNIFAEGLMPGSVTVKNNKFLGCCSPDVDIFTWGTNGIISAGVIKDIHVENNFFYQNRTKSIGYSGAAASTIKNNLIYMPNTNTGITVKYSIDTVVEGNRAYSDRGGFSDVTIDTDSCTNVTAKDNKLTKVG